MRNIAISISNFVGVHATGKEEEQGSDCDEQQARSKIRMWFSGRYGSIDDMSKEIGIGNV